MTWHRIHMIADTTDTDNCKNDLTENNARLPTNKSELLLIGIIWVSHIPLQSKVNENSSLPMTWHRIKIVDTSDTDACKNDLSD